MLYLFMMMLLSGSLHARSTLLEFRDKDSGEPLKKVSIILLHDKKKQKLGTSDTDGRYKLEFQKKFAPNKVMIWKKDYKKEYFSYEELMKQKTPLYLQEKKAPDEVTGLQVEKREGKFWLSWKAPADKDVDYYTVYTRVGLEPYKKWKDDLKKPETQILTPEEAKDYYYQVKAIDKNKNRNKGSELHYYQPVPQIQPKSLGQVRGKIPGLKGYPCKVLLYPVSLGDSLNVDASPLQSQCGPQGSFFLDKVPAGIYTVKVWEDINGNGAWDGNWLGNTPEPRAIAYKQEVQAAKTLDLELKLEQRFTGVPRIIYDAQPAYVDLYNAAWNMARAKITPGQTENGFVPAYMDEGFNNHIYQWDTCFMMFFGIYGGDEFPAMNSLDNFYLKQRPNGYICRVQNEDTGGDYDPSLSDPSVNPPLYAWIEWTYYRITGDNSRLLWAMTHLDKYYKWLQNNTRREAGHYFTSNLGSGMDNSPREGQAYGWIDMTSQMALFAYYMQAMASECGVADAMRFYSLEYKDLYKLVNTTLWDSDQNMYFDIKKNGKLHKKKTIASFWPLLARIVPMDRIKGLVTHLEDPAEFKTPHVFPTLAKDEPEYDKKGYYWRGGVWAPTTFMTIKGLEYNGLEQLAYQASLNHIDNMWKVYEQFVPDKARLPYKEGNIPFPSHLDGTKQIWELYSPELTEAGTRWDNNFYCRPEFVGWSGVGPIVLMMENVLGIIPDALSGTITWTIRSEQRHGVQGLLYKGHSVDLIMKGIKEGVPQLEVRSDVDFKLKYIYKGRESVIIVKAD